MGEAQPVLADGTLTMDGLDEIFIASNPEVGSVQSTVLSEHYTVEQTASILGLSVKTVRRKLASGKLDGYKISGPNGPEWRVKSESLDNVHTQTQARPACPEPVQGQQTGTLDTTIFKDLLEKIEVLTYKTGYLEAQLAAKENELREVKLLVDSRKGGWWSRFCNWALGKSESQNDS